MSSTDSTSGSRPRSGWAVWLAWGGTGVAACLLVVVLAIGLNRAPAVLSPPEQKLTNVEVRTVVTEPHEEALVLPARLIADREAAVSAETQGTLARWLVGEGETVTAGKVVAELDTTMLDARKAELVARRQATEASVTLSEQSQRLAEVGLEQAREDLSALTVAEHAAKANLALATKEFDRVSKLAAAEVATEAAADTAQNARVQAELAVTKVADTVRKARLAVRTAELQVQQAATSLALARANLAAVTAEIGTLEVSLSKAQLRAPVDGRVEEHLVEAGEVVQAGAPLAKLYDLTRLRAAVDVPDRYVPFLDMDNSAVDDFVRLSMPGAQRRVRCSVILPGLPKLTGGTYQGLELPAEIARIAQAADPASNTFRVELRLENPGAALKEGILVQARIAYLAYPEALVIPLTAVHVSDVGPRVLVAEDRDGRTTVSVRDVEPVSIRGDRMLLAGGLQVGDGLVVAGGKGLVNGEAVRVVMRDGNVVADTSGPAADSPSSSESGP